MRALVVLFALALAIPATVAFALPHAAPELPPVLAPAVGPERASEGESEAAHEHPAHEDEDASEGRQAAPSGAHAHERTRTTWPPATGSIPSSTKGLVEIRNLHIEGEPDLAKFAELGVDLRGSGTLADPYVLEGLWVTRELEIQDTADYYVVRGNVIDGTLRLNWNDDRVHVHHNAVRDLRVNENIERKGEATGGLIEKNRFGIVGQIRHYDGVFRENEVGPIPSGFFDDVTEDSGIAVPFAASPRALNIDGFSGALFERNTILGYVEMQLHGHHHASCFDCHSHNHAVGAMGHDHTIRYHEGTFRANTIAVEDGVAFRYTDAAHRGDDRTANSEPNEALRLPHVHYTRLAIEDNLVEGGPLVIDILNADSRDHANEETDEVEPAAVHDGHAYRAELSLRGNTVRYTLPDQPARVPWLDAAVRDGILVRAVKEARLVVADNDVALAGAAERSTLGGLPGLDRLLPDEAPAALHLQDVRAARLVVEGNALAGAHYGVLAERFDEDASWELRENAFRDVREDVAHDERSGPEREG